MQSNRIKELDLVKTFTIIISMIGIHVMYHLADYEALSSTLTANVLNVLATAWGAPVFMFCMGITLGFSRHQEPSDWLRRGISLITIGMVLNLLRWGPYAFTSVASGDPELMKGVAMIFNVDILQFAGLAFMLLALCKRLRMSAFGILALSVGLNVLGTVLTANEVFTPSYVVNQFLGFFYHTPTASCFPLLNWFIFVAAGNVMGKVYQEGYNLDRVFSYILPICGTLAIMHQYLSFTGDTDVFTTLNSDWDFYNMTTTDALCIAFGVAPFMLGLFRLLSKIIPDQWMNVLGYPSRHINQFYCVSWLLIMWTYCFLYRIAPSATLIGFYFRWFIITALTIAVILIYNKYLCEKVAPFFTNKTAWTVSVWAVSLLLGAFYFTNVSGPYMMPY